MSGENCVCCRLDPRADGMPRGCISCRFCDGFGRCRANGGDGETGDAWTRARAGRELSDGGDVVENV